MDKKFEELFLDTFIVAPSATKKFFLNLKYKNPRYNFKFLTKEELQEHTFGKIDQDKAILLLMKKEQFNFSIAKRYVNFIKRGARGKVDDKINFDSFKSLLENNKLIKLDETFKHLIQKKKVIFVSYSENNLEIKNLINTLKLKDFQFIKFSSFFKENPAKTIYKFEGIEEEVKHVLNLVAKDLDENKPVKIICSKDSYSYYLDLFGSSIGLKFNYQDKDSLFNTELGKELFNIVRNDNKKSLLKYIKDNEKQLKDKYKEQVELIQNVLISFDVDSFPLSTKIINLKEILKTYSKSNVRYEKAPIVTSSIDFDESYEYYFLNVIEGNFPSLSTNNDILDDKNKELINIETSEQHNEMVIDISRAFMNFKNNMFFSYFVVNNNIINEPSFFVLNGKDPETIKTLNYEYSKIIATNFYKTYDYQNKKYGDVRESLKHYVSTSGLELKDDYDPSFKGIEFSFDPKFIYSYSSMSAYYGCPFQFYCDRVLNLNIQEEESFYIKYGKAAHYILEHVYKNDVDFDKLFDGYMQSRTEFSKKDNFFIESLKERLRYAFKKISERRDKGSFDGDPEPEKTFTYTCPDYKLKGTLDSIVLLKSKHTGAKYLYVVDYKTGEPPTFVKDEVKNGDKDSLQLATYMFLLQNESKYKEYRPVGFYIQPLKFRYRDIIKESVDLSLRGITLDNRDVLNAIDKDISESLPKGNGILNINYVKKRGCFNNCYSETAFKEIYEDVEKVLSDFNKNYKAGIFNIESASFKVCKDCKYSDLCYLKNRRIKK